MKAQTDLTVGTRVKDKDGNEFVIRSIVDHRDPLIDASVTLKGQGGEKVIGSLDLKHYAVIKPNIEIKIPDIFTLKDNNKKKGLSM